MAPRGQKRLLKLKTHTFLKKKHVFSQNVSLVVSWAPAAQGPPHDATFYAYCLLGFYFCKLHTFSCFLSCLGVLCSEETPERVFRHFFRKRFRTRACTDLQCTFAQKCFFCNVKKVRSKDLIGYSAWGLPQGPAFACTLTISNKTKKQKLKKTQVLFGDLI